MRSLDVAWKKCAGGLWCSFMELKDLDAEYFDNLRGIYLIFQMIPAKSTLYHTIYAGSGIIRNRILDHRTEPYIKRYKNLLVTWAEVSTKPERQGIEKFLGDTLIPLEGHAYPDVDPIEVFIPYRDARVFE